MPFNTQYNTFIFDLDQTLYPYNSQIIRHIDTKIALYCQNIFKVSLAEAQIIRENYFRLYGTTLGGLLQETNIDAEDYLDFVHDVDYSDLNICPYLEASLKNLTGRKIIYTNATTEHAQRVLEKRGIAGYFENIFDIRHSGFRAKPCPSAFQDFIKKYHIPPKTSVFFDDNIANIRTAKQLGITAYHIREGEIPDNAIQDTEFPIIYNMAEFLTNYSAYTLSYKTIII